MRRAFAIALVGIGLLSTSAISSAIRLSDERQVDRLFALCRKFGHTPQNVNCFYRPEIWRESKKVADKSGPQIIHAVMRRARRYPANEQSEGP
jgi:hypothetical protein